MMELGLGTLRLSPTEFWAATPREIAAAFGASPRLMMTRDEFDRLSNRFPDQP
jgi:uncharacterized phage protein (TIGR02216 family)